MRTLYTLLWVLALPWLPLRLWWRGRREPGYRLRVGERFGFYGTDVPAARGDVIWIHAVSLGETRAAAPLVERLHQERPGATIVMTHMTATGREAGRNLYGGRVVQVWLPYDFPFAIRRFLTRFAPQAGLLMETEMWPNLVAACAKRAIALFLVNARLSQRSLEGYLRLPTLTRPMFAALAGVAAQTDEDARRLAAAGASDVVTSGNLKFDVDINREMRDRGNELRKRFGAGRPVWVAASTREGEEALLLGALARAALPKDALTVVVPRHPQRFDTVAALLDAQGIAHVRRSSGRAVPADVSVVLGDTLGELPAYYTAADVAFVGGSLVPTGGQNLIEAIAAGTPTLIGPHTFNFAEATTRAVETGAALRVRDADTLLSEVAALLADAGRRTRMRVAAQSFHAAHRGAADRLWQWLAARLPAAVGVSRRADD